VLIKLQSNLSDVKLYSDFTFEFHISRTARKKYDFYNELFSINGNVVLADFKSVRKFVDTINSKREISQYLRYGEVNAVGLMDEIYHFIIRLYEETMNPGVFKNAIIDLNKKIGEDEIRKLVFEFIELYPPSEVYKGKISVFDYLNSLTGSKSNYEITLEELMLLYFANYNPANKKMIELFDEKYFKNYETYQKVISALNSFFTTQPRFGPDNQDLFKMLKTPIISNPDNLWDQLEFIRMKWGVILKDYFTERILSSKDLMREDTRFDDFSGGIGAPPTVVPVYKGKVLGSEHLTLGKSHYKYAHDAEHDFHEPEQFTKDIHWMPSVVLMAKNVYVWLDQLSKKYQREIKRLNQVPNEELDLLVQRNFTGLWLIGLWERSSASKRIKHIMGNIDAVASAYSLYDYQIAHDLGGEIAFDNLNERAKARGLRLASDMVPNHTGIYSDWIVRHPEYFIQTKSLPFAGYKFTGEDLSEDSNVEIRIEDGYYTKDDAAVVFRRFDKRNNDVRYIYHGNDGTNMPWNDTAQLDLIKKEVREAVIQKIFEVARRFSIIRFDAAMTLTKRHFSRLWYPQPGTGGDIPSRADYALTKQEFDEVFPEEFWREVVDRINYEMPETLLLAEAFWLMEGYFVRSLGMHRVYNSAFMHMMMKEENEKYRDLITNTLEFEPEILKRYVNFMSNPDEETAIRQFGTDDKYFGVLMLMVTLPGLPMFAHGQIEGYTEKYGMEYQRAYYNEEPKQSLVERHEREIFPLMRKRYLFAEVENFWFFDCVDEYGNINENVFAFTNSYKNEKVLVLYNNKYEAAYGKINVSTPKLVSDGKGNKFTKSITLIEALGIKGEDKYFYICRDFILNQEFLLKGSDMVLGGYYLHINGFNFKVLGGFEEVNDNTGKYNELYKKLHNQSVPSIRRAYEDLVLQPVHESFEKIFRDNEVSFLIDHLITHVDEEKDSSDELKVLGDKFYQLVNEIISKLGNEHFDFTSDNFVNTLKQIKNINLALMLNYSPATHTEYLDLNKSILISEEANYKENFLILLLFVIVTELQKIFDIKLVGSKSSIIDEMRLITPVTKIIKRIGRGEEGVRRQMVLLKILINFSDKLFDMEKGPKNIFDIKTGIKIKSFVSEIKGNLIKELLNDEDVNEFLLTNEYKGVWYYSKERFEELVNWLFTIALLKYLFVLDSPSRLPVGSEESTETYIQEKVKEFISQIYKVGNYIIETSDRAGYRLEILKEFLLNK
jgi:glycosidase